MASPDLDPNSKDGTGKSLDLEKMSISQLLLILDFRSLIKIGLAVAFLIGTALGLGLMGARLVASLDHSKADKSLTEVIIQAVEAEQNLEKDQYKTPEVDDQREQIAVQNQSLRDALVKLQIDLSEKQHEIVKLKSQLADNKVDDGQKHTDFEQCIAKYEKEIAEKDREIEKLELGVCGAMHAQKEEKSARRCGEETLNSGFKHIDPGCVFHVSLGETVLLEPDFGLIAYNGDFMSENREGIFALVSINSGPWEGSHKTGILVGNQVELSDDCSIKLIQRDRSRGVSTFRYSCE